MINLLLPEQKNNVKREYIARVVAVLLISVFITLTVAISLLVPVYILLKDKEASAEKYLIGQSNGATNEKDFLKNIINDTNKKLSILNKEEDGSFIVHTDIFKTILGTRKNVRINSITYQNNGVVIPVVRISGIANTREDLQLFTKRLDGEVNFTNVNAPISNFVQDRNIEFSLEITLQ